MDRTRGCRLRWLLLAGLALALLGMATSPAAAGVLGPAVVLAQTGAEEEAEGQEGTNQGPDEGQGGAEAESGAGGQTEEGESTQSEVPWTFQMARLSVVLLLALAAGIGLLYYRLIVKRQRGEV
jgi:hypothetical protein